jgi:exosortase A
MRPEATLQRAKGLAAIPLHLRPWTVVAAAWVVLIVLFRSDWSDMVGQWLDSSTYNHILLVPVIIGWLIHQRWTQLMRLKAGVWWPALLAFAAALLVWLLGAVAGFNLFKQIGAVAVLPAVAAMILGPRLAAALTFPLGYMAFLVPFGDELVPPLQMVTAWLTIQLTHLSGIPAAVNGVFIDTPAGLFEVAEACSGVKFLIAMIALGVLVANVCFISWKRRIGFLALAIVVPIVANGIRAWATIYAAQSIGAEAAGGFDHIVYGWLFFAVVIAAVLGLAWRWFDRPFDAELVDVAAIETSPWLAQLERLSASPVRVLSVSVALLVGVMGWSTAAERLSAPIPTAIDLPQVAGWTRVDYRPQIAWEPRAAGAEHRLMGRYRDAEGREVDVFYALYSAQRDGKEAGGFGEGALPTDGVWSWSRPGAGAQGGKADWLLAEGRVSRLAQTWYRTGNLLSGSNTRLKLATISDRLLLRARPTAALILSVEGQSAATAEKSLADFRAATGPLPQWMDRMAGLR